MNEEKKEVSRRNFVKNASLAASSFMIIPRHVMGRGFVAPSDKLNIAAIGAGGKGGDDIKNFATSPKVNIVALCDVDEVRSAESRKRFPQGQVLQRLARNARQGKKQF